MPAPRSSSSWARQVATAAHSSLKPTPRLSNAELVTCVDRLLANDKLVIACRAALGLHPTMPDAFCNERLIELVELINGHDPNLSRVVIATLREIARPNAPPHPYRLLANGGG